MNFVAPVRSAFGRAAKTITMRLSALWVWYRRLRSRWQIALAVLAAALLIGLIALALSGGKAPETTNTLRTVTLQSVGSLSGNGDSVSVIGTVRSVSEAQILAQSGGTVRRVHTRIGASVPAGAILAELDNASERAVVLQAQGSYEAALAARSITLLQAGNTGKSLEETETAARNLYRTSYTTIDSAIEVYIDPLMSGLERIDGVDGRQVRTRAEIRDELNSWRYSFDRIEGESPEALLARAEATTQKVSSFLVDFARTANNADSGASSTERAGVATARTSVEGVLTSLSTQREALRDAQTAVGVASQQTTSTSARTASADASVKQALGSLRIAQASLEKTIIRAPIGGTINFLPIRVGDYVTSFTHVATVANNGSLEIVTYVSAADRELIAVGEQVTVEEAYTGIITSIAPALDPNTKRIEVRVAVTGTTELVNGQSVRIAFAHTVARPDAQLAGPVLLPLSAVKLRTSDRIVFTVDETGMLVAVPVEIGEVRGDRIEITSALPLEVHIVTDARGLSEGQRVNVADDI